MAGLIVHEWVEKTGGSEKVVDQFVHQFPDADVFVLWSNDPGRFGQNLRESWISRTPLRRSKVTALPFEIPTWRRIPERRSYEWILSSSHLFAHHARVPRQRDIPKFVYAHTPARYIWEPDLDERGRSAAARVISTAIKPLDRLRAQEARAIATNSEFTRARAKRTWHRDSVVIYPPVDVARITSTSVWAEALDEQERLLLESIQPGYLLGASRFVSYKRLDLVIAAGEASGRPVVIAGAGGLKEEIVRRGKEASVPVVVVESPRDRLLFALYQRAFGFVFPAVEDFGIMPVEAMAAGTPVIVGPVGGAKESVNAAQGGVVLRDYSTESLREAVTSLEHIDRGGLPARAGMFSNEAFRARIGDWIANGI